MSITILANGRLLDETGERMADVSFDAATGTISDIGPDLVATAPAAAAVTVIDIAGCVVTPGFVDLHAHLREPGDEAAETVVSGARAAALGGFTAVVAMPDTRPCLDSPDTLRRVLDAASGAVCEIRPAAAISVGLAGAELSPMGELADLGVSLFTDAGHGVHDTGFLRRALEYAADLHGSDGHGVVLAQSCDDASMAAGGVMHEGVWSVRLGLAGRPALAEELMVMRDLALCRLVGARLHLQRLSTAGSVALVRAAKAEGLPVTAEVTPHHFTLTDADCAGYDPRFKVQPPLRTAVDVEAVRAGLADGTIDAIATDHSPHSLDAKERPFDQAPAGMLGLESALAVALAHSGLGLERLLPLMSWQPASIAGLSERHGQPIRPGARANLAVIDLEQVWTLQADAAASRSTNTPFAGRRFKGKVRHTVYDGELVVIDGMVMR